MSNTVFSGIDSRTWRLQVQHSIDPLTSILNELITYVYVCDQANSVSYCEWMLEMDWKW